MTNAEGPCVQIGTFQHFDLNPSDCISVVDLTLKTIGVTSIL